MAKGKHSTALFEVIHSAKKPERIAQSLRTPKWWFKSSHASAQTPPAPEPTFEANEPSAPAQQPAPKVAGVDYGRSSAVHMDFDRRRQELTFRLRYTTVVVSGFAVCVVIGLAYVVGRHLGHGPQAASAQQPSIEQLQQLPAHPNVTNVTKPKITAPRTLTPAEPSHSRTLAGNVQTPRQTNSNSLIPASADTQLPRKPHLDYAIIGVFPSEKRAKAEAARDYFTSHGIPCTLEKTGWTLGAWISLVGTAGFPSTSIPDWKTYVSNIMKVEDGMKSSFDKINPGGYGWKGDEQPY